MLRLSDLSANLIFKVFAIIWNKVGAILVERIFTDATTLFFKQIAIIPQFWHSNEALWIYAAQEDKKR